MSNCILDVPSSIESKTELFFKSVLLGTYLSLTIEDGSILIKSDNLSVMAIMKDSFTADASARKITVNVEETELDWTSLDHVINILHPMVQRQYDVAQKFQLIDGLKEIVAGEEDTSFLSQDYREILKDAEEITAKYNEQPKMLAFLWSIIADLFGDASKIKGRHNVGG